MPDNRLTLANLREHFRKNIAIYIAGIAVMLVLASQLWTATTPRSPTEQTVVIYLASSYFDADALSPIADDVLERTQAFDDTLRRVEFQGLQFADSEDDYTSNILLMTRLSVHEGDVFLASAAAMDALVNAGGAMPLDSFLEAGWLSEYGLEPYTVTEEDEETGARRTYVAGLRLDSVDALSELGAFNNRGAFLVLSETSDNPETARKAVEFLLDDLTRDTAEEGSP